MVLWLIGLSGSGKTTVGRELWSEWKKIDPSVVFLDGDELREVWGDSLGHSIEARRKNARRISHLCLMLDRQGINVVACVLSMFPEWQDWNRQKFSRYFEVFLRVPMHILEQRDPKGIYRRFRNGELSDVVGLDIEFPEPLSPDLIINHGDSDADPLALADLIMDSAGLV